MTEFDRLRLIEEDIVIYEDEYSLCMNDIVSCLHLHNVPPLLHNMPSDVNVMISDDDACAISFDSKSFHDELGEEVWHEDDFPAGIFRKHLHFYRLDLTSSYFTPCPDVIREYLLDIMLHAYKCFHRVRRRSHEHYKLKRALLDGDKEERATETTSTEIDVLRRRYFDKEDDYWNLKIDILPLVEVFHFLREKNHFTSKDANDLFLIAQAIFTYKNRSLNRRTFKGYLKEAQDTGYRHGTPPDDDLIQAVLSVLPA